MKKSIGLPTLYAVVSLAVFAVVLPAQTPVWKGKIYKDGDLTVVQNPKEPIYKGEILTLKEELRLGGADAKGDNSSSRIMSIAVDRGGNIYVLDYMESHVKVFDKSGRYLRTIGRKGQGPGELDSTQALDLFYPSDSLFVLEGARISIFDSMGKFSRTLSLRGFGNLQMQIDTRGHIYLLSFVLEEKETSYRINKYDSELKPIALMAQTPGLIDMSGTNDPFGPLPFFAVDVKNRFLYGFPKAYEIRVFDENGKETGRILKDYDPVEVTAEEIEAAKKNNPPDIKLKFGKYHAPFRRFYPDDGGRLFVKTYRKAGDGRGYIYDVFDAKGRFLGATSLADKPLLIKGNHLYSLEEDEEGYQIIKRYTVTWKH